MPNGRFEFCPVVQWINVKFVPIDPGMPHGFEPHESHVRHKRHCTPNELGERREPPDRVPMKDDTHFDRGPPFGEIVDTIERLFERPWDLNYEVVTCGSIGIHRYSPQHITTGLCQAVRECYIRKGACVGQDIKLGLRQG